jgi:hypothetical protein
VPQLKIVIGQLCAGQWLSTSELAALVDRDADKLQTRFLTAMAEHLPGMLAKRQVLIDLGVLAPPGGDHAFTQDYTFNSPSTAASVVLGRSANGRLEWKDAQGRSLKALQGEGVN